MVYLLQSKRRHKFHSLDCVAAFVDWFRRPITASPLRFPAASQSWVLTHRFHYQFIIVRFLMWGRAQLVLGQVVRLLTFVAISASRTRNCLRVVPFSKRRRRVVINVEYLQASSGSFCPVLQGKLESLAVANLPARL
nr:uncharacterized protein LOC112273026 [Physcomitrium patens]|eukprot:XP_024357107.1 uncharacterized protein LOC112273026 [Physcomitrella patens]